jgi:hypothetical protein
MINLFGYYSVQIVIEKNIVAGSLMAKPQTVNLKDESSTLSLPANIEYGTSSKYNKSKGL